MAHDPQVRSLDAEFLAGRDEDVTAGADPEASDGAARDEAQPADLLGRTVAAS